VFYCDVVVLVVGGFVVDVVGDEFLLRGDVVDVFG